MSYEKTPLLQRFGRLWRLSKLILVQSRRFTRPESAVISTRNHIISSMSCEILNVMNVRLEVLTPKNGTGHNSMLVVSNHVSWLDVFAISALCPSSFIAMKEMQSWPLLGKIATNAGTVFIDRKNRKNINPINKAISASLEEGHNVCFFPESATSSGIGLLPFKAALFESAIQADAPIQPIALRYYDSTGSRTTVPSFSDVNLIRSLWRILSMKEITVVVDFAAPVVPSEHPGKDRFALKDMAETPIREKVYEDSPEQPPEDAVFSKVP
ncbi:1-acylglycerol-3-phosphate O-acyltransferase [Neisseria wadsworthii]|uniref:1-acyl-sn-glycerol-3-phosphate acyltransferase n=1 Tax=Neisseria wadsworthii 9715 TaxID=1030841 RepID=G4CNV5_9NEIS|nr:1-acylglycerol-3-phosphate O-acyltransferase [Neisseria wadsworthii]EGZ48905.1 1-acylglycerol-3-phosphate O-acyltransferase [Neisseria wadsworthii 9715]QMT36711.1 1-acylglycerol-3-phosphate O-acyltransferase [Neisseria wadsworthii]